jgi:hypothetical protein
VAFEHRFSESLSCCTYLGGILDLFLDPLIDIRLAKTNMAA